jgi:hypothetical protein
MAKKTVEKDSVQVTITSCAQCAHCKVSRWYTADSFEMVMAYNCRHKKYAKTENGTTDREEWLSPPGITTRDTGDPDPKIPKWCPLRKK